MHELLTLQDFLLLPNARRVVLRPFMPGDPARARRVVERVEQMSPARIERALESARRRFAMRHDLLEERVEERYTEVIRHLDLGASFSPAKRQLLGCYFLAEYSVEAAALFNPSVVRGPDQAGCAPGHVRYVMSMRAVGEGHLSSIVFRTLQVDTQTAKVRLEDAPCSLATSRYSHPETYHRDLFTRKAKEIGFSNANVYDFLSKMPERFDFEELRTALQRSDLDPIKREKLEDLAHANSVLECDANGGGGAAACVLFPFSDSTSRGLEDARFVHFESQETYYATFTAYNGRSILPQLLSTTDFKRFHFVTLNGPQAQDKGMALFPRKVNDEFVMLSRQDGENLYIMRSEHLHFWNTRQPLAQPKYDWECMQIGNCGSPLETPEGWLMLTHGVGPLRQYSISAMLLDLEDPSRVRARLSVPLIEASEEDREGYVPNVVYTCGMAKVGQDHLLLPFASGDTRTRLATARISELLDELLRPEHIC